MTHQDLMTLTYFTPEKAGQWPTNTSPDHHQASTNVPIPKNLNEKKQKKFKLFSFFFSHNSKRGPATSDWVS
jgi:hypothetical protein